MDPAQYYSQNPSSHPNQHQAHGGNNQQLVRADPNVVSEYIRSLYSNPTQYQLAAPTNDPAFYQLAQQMVLEKKHKMEQMLLAIQQQSELSTMMSAAGISDPGYTQVSGTSGSMHPQFYQQPPVHPAVYQNSAWGNATNQWSHIPQGYVPQQEQHIRSAHISPEVETRSLYPDQRYLHSAQAGVTSEASTSRQPQQLVQSQHQHFQQQPPLAQSGPQAQRHTQYQAQPEQHAQRGYQSQLNQPQQITSASQQYPAQASIASTTQLYQPQPQPYPGRHPLQPDRQQPQAGPSQTSQTKSEREQAATTQKQLQYLASLQQQHQRARQGHILPAGSDPSSAQPPNPPPVSTSSQPAPALPQGPSAPPGNPDQTPATPNRSQSPSKPLRSTPSFSLMDLRAPRRRSDRVALAEQEPNPDATREGAHEPEQGVSSSVQAGVPSSAIEPTEKGSSAIGPGPGVPVSNDHPQPGTGTLRSSLEPLKHGNAIMSSNISTNTPSTAATRPPPPFQAAPAEPARATPATPVEVAVPIQDSTAPKYTLATSGAVPDASVPALNTSSSGIVHPNMPAQGSSGSPAISAADAKGQDSLKDKLDRLHVLGIDCVSIVRRAAELGGASTEHLQRPSARLGPKGELIPLFASGQPLQLWMAGLKVSRTQGDEVLKQISLIAMEAAQRYGPDAIAAWSGRDTGSSAGSVGITSTQKPIPAPGHHSIPNASPVVATAPVGTMLPAPHPLPVPAGGPSTLGHQPGFNAPTVQSHGPQIPTEVHNTALAQHQRLAPRPVGPVAHGPAPQHSYQAHPIYQRAGTQGQSQPPATQQPAQVARTPMQAVQHPQISQKPRPQKSAPKPTKTGGGTPALDFLRTLGIDVGDGSSSAADSDAASDTSRGRKGKGKAKAKAIEEVATVPHVAAPSPPPAPSPSVMEPAVVEPAVVEPVVVESHIAAPSVSQPEAQPEEPGPSLSEAKQLASESALPAATAESPILSVEAPEPPPLPDQPAAPLSPLLAPAIAVLPEPRSPSTPASPPPELSVDPVSALEHENAAQSPGAQAVADVASSTIASAPASVPVLANIPAPVPPPVQTPTPAPSPGPSQYVVLPVISSPSVPATSDVSMADPIPSGLPRASSTPAIRPVSSASQRPPAPAEYVPLKRKRDSVPGPPPEPSDGLSQSWAEVYAKAANQLANKISENNRAKKARSEAPQPTRPAEPSKDKGKSKAVPLFKAETPPQGNKGKGKRPLFQPETPPIDAEDEGMDAIIDVVGDDIRPPAPVVRQPTSKQGKRRLIMEVVLPLRKKTKTTKGNAKPQGV
ncbi:hypothetical protein RhiJN_15585 [Ceratobasidium sp. AG-Ba]|nr:hypothetical protein RhiJN_15585 [Ceratobasidium sp. AG-Ba]